MAFCGQCGTRLSEGAAFCPKCGTKVAMNVNAAGVPAQAAPAAAQSAASQVAAAAVGPAIQALREAIVIMGGPGIAEVGEVAAKGETIISAWQGRL